MSLEIIIEREIKKYIRQKLNESNIYGFPEGNVDSGKVFKGGKDGDWGGSMEKALYLLDIAKKCKNSDYVVSSQKRSKKNARSGNMSDHYIGNLSAYAVDIPTKGKEGNELLSCIMKKWNNGSNSDYKGGRWLNVNKDGYRYQFGWNVADHYDHIHIGVKKTGSNTSSNTTKTDDEGKNFLVDLILKLTQGSSSNFISKINEFFKDLL